VTFIRLAADPETVVRDTLRNAMLALLGVVAIALTARTLPTARQQRQRGGGGSGGSGSGDGGGLPAQSTDPLPQLLDLPFLTELITVLGIVLALVVLVALFRHRRHFFRVAVAVLIISFVLAALLQVAPFDPFPEPASSAATPVANASTGGGGSASGTADGPSLLSVALLAVAGLVVLGTAVAANRRVRTADSDSTTETESTAGGATAVGRAAGRAADRLEETADLDNEVYRAFREMTVPLDVTDPETTTAREFERAAVEAGMVRADVTALTDLFERARYDEYEVDAADEQRAVELLRRIEDRYAEDDP